MACSRLCFLWLSLLLATLFQYYLLLPCYFPNFLILEGLEFSVWTPWISAHIPLLIYLVPWLSVPFMLMTSLPYHQACISPLHSRSRSLTAYLKSLLGCLISISHLTHPSSNSHPLPTFFPLKKWQFCPLVLIPKYLRVILVSCLSHNLPLIL